MTVKDLIEHIKKPTRIEIYKNNKCVVSFLTTKIEYMHPNISNAKIKSIYPYGEGLIDVHIK